MSDRIDLHMHSTVSDGTDTPEELLLNVCNAGIGLFALTDHDAVKGCREIIAARSEGDPAFLTGVEFSCRDGEGRYHILGYGYDPDSEGINSVVDLGHSYRMKKARARLDFLHERFGFIFSEEEIGEILALDNPGKPHIGNLMVKRGYARSKGEAIKEYIDEVNFPDEYVRPEEAISGILASGGIPVLAHPSYGSGDELIIGDDMDARLRKLMDFGLKGVEAFYSGFSSKLRREVLSFAKRYDLYVTAGSDYHGRNKMIALGDTGLGEERPEGLISFLAAVKDRI